MSQYGFAASQVSRKFEFGKELHMTTLRNALKTRRCETSMDSG